MKKGFTLIELLAVIVIMGIVFGLITANIINIIDKSANKEYESLSNIIEADARIYIEKIQPVELDVVGGTYCVTLQNLSDEGLVDLPVVDPRDDSTFGLTTCTYVETTSLNEYYFEFNRN